MHKGRRCVTLQNYIKVIGARQNNLKGFDIDIPLNRITVVTGVSGSGKSSFAFDTLYAEGQRRYIETFSPYARQFMDRMDKPDVEKIEGIPPSIAIEQKNPIRTSRSTVGSITELTDFTKLLFARIGILYCPRCTQKVIKDTPSTIWEILCQEEPEKMVILAFPYPNGNFDPSIVKQELQRQGFHRVMKKGDIVPLDTISSDFDELSVVVDRFTLKTVQKSRVIDSIEQALRFGKGHIRAFFTPDKTLRFSTHLHCPYCDIYFKEPIPNLFSFNSPLGACPSCRGFGRIIDIDMDQVIPDPHLSLEKGAIKPWGKNHPEYHDLMHFCRQNTIPTSIPFKNLEEWQQRAIKEGTGAFYGIRGFFNYIESKSYKMHIRVFLSRYRGYFTCPACNGTRFKAESLLYKINGLHIGEIYALSIGEAYDFFHNLHGTNLDDASQMILQEIISRLTYLNEVGLSYLTLDRQSRTLSGGEVQRVSLTKALGSSLVNTLYILDEPSIGLHPRDSHRLVTILKTLARHNTVIVVEHDLEVIAGSDYLLDLGPGAGESGGNIMYFGPLSDTESLKDSKALHSKTIDYISQKLHIPTPLHRRDPYKGPSLRVTGCREHNLKNISVTLPLGVMTCLTGVSGSGKSTLAEDILYKGIKHEKGATGERPGIYETMEGLRHIKDVILIDQKQIGKTPRSNPVSYIGGFSPIRDLFAKTPLSLKRGYKSGMFSFNLAEGRCATCQGNGFEKVEMQFLSDVFITCPDCNGTRYKKQVLEVTYKNKNISDILSMTFSEAQIFFSPLSALVNILQPMIDIGLGYLRLGQPLNTLSGGESQRLKLAKYLLGGTCPRSFFILDEPTTGLHLEDVRQLLTTFEKLIHAGHSLLVIEHNMEVVKCADFVIDLGPEGGEKGGEIITQGTPEQVAHAEGSYTGKFLQRYLKASSSPRVASPSPPLWIPEEKDETIRIKGAREHNLKDITVSIPRDQLLVITGISGSGKSTLAFDVLFSEGQRRYIESLPTYIRQYIKIMERPDIDLITGIPPTVAIEQRMNPLRSRSTVATITEIYHYLRLLFCKTGVQYCRCKRPIRTRSDAEIMERIMTVYEDREIMLLVPKVTHRKGTYKEVFEIAAKRGFTKARVDGTFVDLGGPIVLERYKEHSIDLVINEIKVASMKEAEIKKIIEMVLMEGRGIFYAVDRQSGKEEAFNRKGYCPQCETVFEELDPRFFSFNSRYGACPACNGLGFSPENGQVCSHCEGKRLNELALLVKIAGYTIADMTALSVEEAKKFFPSLSLSKRDHTIAHLLMPEILTRLEFLQRVGLPYLTLNRRGDTLSGGESQRIRLAAQLGSNLRGVCYILDEPTIGLHPRDNEMLLDSLAQLKNHGNSVIIVEHDEETIKRADYILDLGPGAGGRGGEVIAKGTFDEIKKSNSSVTGKWLRLVERRHISSRLRTAKEDRWLKIEEASLFNLKDIDVSIPLGTLVCITGVSGSGKSTLLRETVQKGLKALLDKKEIPRNICKKIHGWRFLDRILEVDHTPIGKTPRSTPGTYIGFYDHIRKLFATLPQARIRGYTPGRFSFNVKSGRCEACSGVGRTKEEMSFLPDVYITCDVCGGQRFNEETLEVTYNGKNIAHILNLSIEEGLNFFSAIPHISRPLKLLTDIGLGYLQIGQPSTTLSGGEAQRIKLAYELCKVSRGKTMYILDEPTTGLHLADIEKLLHVFQELVNLGNTIVIIEHNLEVIKEADYIIDLGPEGGEGGGRIVAQGSPHEILHNKDTSYTARFLAHYLGAHSDIAL
ncbi:MAG: excinuclease ABC subunit UvrA [bacterium]